MLGLGCIRRKFRWTKSGIGSCFPGDSQNLRIIRGNAYRVEYPASNRRFHRPEDERLPPKVGYILPRETLRSAAGGDDGKGLHTTISVAIRPFSLHAVDGFSR